MDRCWTKVLDEIKWIVTRENLLLYPYFSECFDIHTDDSELQIVAVIIQKVKRNTYYIHKLIKPVDERKNGIQ